MAYIDKTEAEEAACVEKRAMTLTGPFEIGEGSLHSWLMSSVRDMPDVRTGLVETVKAEIAAGEYETPVRLDMAIDGLVRATREMTWLSA